MSQNPGCFGSVLYHDTDGRRCSVCPLKEACSSKVSESKGVLDTWFKDLVASNKSVRSAQKARKVVAPNVVVSAPTADPQTQAKTTAATGPNPATAHLNKKPREFVDRWSAKGIDFKAYKTGVNGFTHCGNKFAAVAMQFFMDNPLGVTKLQITDELIAKLNWGCGTAGSHAGIILEAFEHLEVITVTGGKAYLR